MTSVVTIDELHALRRAELGSVTTSLQRLGHDVPAAVTTELNALDNATVDVVIRCLLCGAFGTYPAAVDGDGTPRSAICGECDQAVFQDAGDESGA